MAALASTTLHVYQKPQLTAEMNSSHCAEIGPNNEGDFQFQDPFGDNFSSSFASLFDDPVSEALFDDDFGTRDIASFRLRVRGLLPLMRGEFVKNLVLHI